METMELGIEIEIDNVGDFLQDIAREYECEVKDITNDIIIEYLNSNIEAKSTGCFNLIGFETDGWGVCRADTTELEKIIKDYTK
ncbi:hypothetical protein [uncultured Eubacterium sp.]|uniref:hypothetical protein n=1 Tax=uncultured Eubacterium sp. TaxID=165185 RepID=UPI002674FC29|nr:hypothetical protein [uncultured Eubacterium sp.]